ncbi:methyl-accepting chemotaxis protein [Thioploca ingrica]|uniref:Methyl-accepting chemotaxis protein n=1 Tax=Thioploca ingrica TaxID=40754 RepID=A0A090AF82_9GAMM|nr:methyl-accepting chemotaxis protein [Thioploca ingrica]
MLKNSKISTLLYQGFGLMIVFIVVISTFAFLQMHTLSEFTTKLYNHPFMVTNTVRDVNINLLKIREHMRNIAINPELTTVEKSRQAIDDYEQEIHTYFEIIAERFLGDQQDVDSFKNLFDEWKTIRDKIITLAQQGKREEATTAILSGEGAQHFEKLDAAAKKLTDFASNKAKEFFNNANTQTDTIFIWVLVIVFIVISSGIALAFWIANLINQKINLAIGVANRISDGNLHNQIEVDNHTEIGKLLQSLDKMQIQLRERIEELTNTQNQLKERMEEDKRIADNALRINSALDKATTNILITDSEYHIIYLNEAAQQLFREEQGKIRTEIPNFDAEHLLGANINFFHKNPTHQRQLLAKLTNVHRVRINLGGVILDHIITPVINDQGERLGMVIEFNNRTLEVATEQEINEVVQIASQGNFKQRINLDNKTGFFQSFSESINKIMSLTQRMIEDIMRVFAALVQGDLTQTIQNDYTGAFEQLKNDANATVTRLIEIMTDIQQTADRVNIAAEEIMQGNNSLSQRTEQQAASLEETAASMEQMTSTVQQNADNARQATQLAVTATDHAIKGGEVVGAAIQAIMEINKSSQKITDIIGVIDDIAFQTNLLALNAAVEAARAGEQGRGFAVVASEVRNLAQRSASAAKEIKELIKDSVTKVTEGTKLANQSGETLEEIVTAVKKVNDIIAEIAAASQEQSSGIQQVNKAVTQMDEMTQQNAALVEEAAAASESMSTQAQNLKQQVTFFKLGKVSAPLQPEVRKKKLPPVQVKKIAHPHLKSKVSTHKSTVHHQGWEEF